MDRLLQQNFVVVLKTPQDVVNIAGAARAMMNMGLRRLHLVRPAELDAYRIEGITHGAAAVLEQTRVFESLRQALAGANYIVGTTARRRSAAYVWQYPRDAAPELLERAREATVALVFGPEDKGLNNDDLDLCDRVLTIPTDEEYSSLNLAQAVLLIAYELRLAAADPRAELPRPRRAAPPASAEELERLFDDVEQTLTAVDFFKARNEPAILRTVRALARRARLNAREAKLLRAMAIEVRKYLERRATRP